MWPHKKVSTQEIALMSAPAGACMGNPHVHLWAHLMVNSTPSGATLWSIQVEHKIKASCYHWSQGLAPIRIEWILIGWNAYSLWIMKTYGLLIRWLGWWSEPPSPYNKRMGVFFQKKKTKKTVPSLGGAHKKASTQSAHMSAYISLKEDYIKREAKYIKNKISSSSILALSQLR